ERLDLAAGPVERLAHGADDLLRAGGIAVAADGLDRYVYIDAVDRAHLALHRHLHGLRRVPLGIGDERAGQLARHQGEIDVVGAVGEALGRHAHAHLPREAVVLAGAE